MIVRLVPLSLLTRRSSSGDKGANKTSTLSQRARARADKPIGGGRDMSTSAKPRRSSLADLLLPRFSGKDKAAADSKDRSGSGSGKNTDAKLKRERRRSGSANCRSLSLDMVDVACLKEWEDSFPALLRSPDGIQLFEQYLKTEYSDENLLFWRACERFRKTSHVALTKEAEAIFEEFVSPEAARPVNIDYQTAREIEASMASPHHDMFLKAQHSIYLLMQTDSFTRFTKSDLFQASLQRT